MADANSTAKKPYRFHGKWETRFAGEEARFWEKVEKTETCWLWKAATIGAGYGVFASNLEKYAHRWAYRMLVGDIPDGMAIDHLCRVVNCVNPDHLEPVTPAINNQRRPGAFATSTHCKRGHEWSDANTRVTKTGVKFCIVCRAELRRDSKRKGLESAWEKGRAAGESGVAPTENPYIARLPVGGRR